MNPTESMRTHRGAAFLKVPPTNWVLIFSGLAGFVTGFCRPTWHHAVEGAQVLAGVVHYPEITPFYLYQIRAWTLLHQIPAFFLNLGLSEILLSIIVSAVLGMLSYQLLAGAFYAFSKNVAMALLFPFLIDSARLFPDAPTYPLILMGCTASYGIFGLMFGTLALILLSERHYKIAGIMLGLAPAVHTGLGLMTWVLAFGSLAMLDRDAFKKIRLPFLTGLGLSAASWAFHQAFFPAEPLQESFNRKEFTLFILNWDTHRLPVSWTHPAVLLTAVTGLLAGTALKKQLTASLLAAVIFLASVFSLAAVMLSQIPYPLIPMPFLQIMPTRILNIVLLLSPAFLLGFSLRSPQPLVRFVSLMGFAGLFLAARFFPSILTQAFIFFSITLLLLVNLKFSSWLSSASLKVEPVIKALLLGVLLVIAVRSMERALTHRPSFHEIYQDWRENSFLRQVQQGQGILLLGADLSAIQLITRRPVLIDPGALDIISYFPDLGPSMARISKEIYGIDLLNPPEAEDPVAIMPIDHPAQVFESRTLEAWQAIKKKYHVTQVLVSGGKLQLPENSRSDSYILYDIPNS